MNARPTSHPTDETLSSFGLGKLDDRPAEAVSKHLEQCPECRMRVAELPADSFLGRIRDAQEAAHSLLGQSLTGAIRGQTKALAPAPPAASTLPPGLAEHPDYEILRELGRGGMGVVYLAENRFMGHKEVLKVVSGHLINRSGVLDRFFGEIPMRPTSSRRSRVSMCGVPISGRTSPAPPSFWVKTKAAESSLYSSRGLGP
jgi:hypothetical protein